MKCPVCETECEEAKTCSNCGFNDVNRVFLNQEEADRWKQETVQPCRAVYTTMDEKCFQLMKAELKAKVDAMTDQAKMMEDRLMLMQENLQMKQLLSKLQKEQAIMPSTGMGEIELESGIYYVGVDIPAGSTKLVPAENESGDIYYYLYEKFDSQEDTVAFGNFKAQVWINTKKGQGLRVSKKIKAFIQGEAT